jgi:hypothetical protein
MKNDTLIIIAAAGLGLFAIYKFTSHPVPASQAQTAGAPSGGLINPLAAYLGGSGQPQVSNPLALTAWGQATVPDNPFNLYAGGAVYDGSGMLHL